MIAVIEQFPLGMLVSAANSKPLITHIPFIYNHNTKKLVAHIDKNNPQFNTLKNGLDVTVVFRGPDTYISPSIYTGSQLPTWNYIIVHLTGKITLINNPEQAKSTLIAMTRFLEGSAQKYILKPNNTMMNGFINYIQAFEVDITSWEGKFKLSQNKTEQDQLNAKNAIKESAKSSKDSFIDFIYKNN